MSSQQRNFQSMNGISQLDDGAGGLLENGYLSCVGITCETIDALAVKSDVVDCVNLNVTDNLASNELSIGHNIAIGNNAVCNRLYTNDLLVSNKINTKTVCCDRITFNDNLGILDNTNLGYIHTSLPLLSVPILTTNTIKKPINLYLKNGVYIFNYSFNLSLSGAMATNPASFIYGLSTDGLTYNMCKKTNYTTFTFNNLQSYPYFYESCVYEVKDNNYISLLVTHNTTTNVVSNVIIQASKITATRIG
jgi:hypothetical protein